jgi:hypothetical protein
MKRDFSAPILKIDGTEYDDKANLATVSFMALTAQVPGDERMTGEQKLRQYKLAHLVHRGGVQEVSAEDVTLLKERIGKAFSVMVVGKAYELLEQDVRVATLAEWDAAADRRDMPSGAPVPA